MQSYVWADHWFWKRIILNREQLDAYEAGDMVGAGLPPRQVSLHVPESHCQGRPPPLKWVQQSITCMLPKMAACTWHSAVRQLAYNTDILLIPCSHAESAKQQVSCAQKGACLHHELKPVCTCAQRDFHDVSNFIGAKKEPVHESPVVEDDVWHEAHTPSSGASPLAGGSQKSA